MSFSKAFWNSLVYCWTFNKITEERTCWSSCKRCLSAGLALGRSRLSSYFRAQSYFEVNPLDVKHMRCLKCGKATPSAWRRRSLVMCARPARHELTQTLSTTANGGLTFPNLSNHIGFPAVYVWRTLAVLGKLLVELSRIAVPCLSVSSPTDCNG